MERTTLSGMSQRHVIVQSGSEKAHLSITSEGHSECANVASQCFLCNYFEQESKKKTYSCSECKMAFHVDCVSIFYNIMPSCLLDQ